VVAVSDALNPDIRASIHSMTDRLRHRGPDGGGVFTDAHAALGHRRLAIIDRAGGHQPMENEDGSVWIVFNGEVYNHHELRHQLEPRGHRFRTASDTETIIHAYEEWGTGCIQRLEGMFAFAIYDQNRRELLLARDRLGKKPLFYAMFDRTLHFGSEIKALTRSPAWNGEIDHGTFEEYLSLGYILAPRTVYRHVRKLEPGHWLRLSRRGVDVRQYWDVERFDNDRRSIEALAPELDAMLAERVGERLESEVPLGAFLSGGVDSGLVVSYMADAMGRPVNTTTVGFGGRRHNELAPARLTASRHGTDHHEEIIRPELESIFDDVVGAFDEPFADASAVPTYYVSAATRRHVTVALSGDGGDEVFGGYDFRYTPHAIEGRLRPAFRHPAVREAARWASSHWPASPRLPRALRLGGLLGNLARDPADAYYRDLCFLKPERVRLLLGLDPSPCETPASAAITDTYRRCPSPHDLQRAQYADLKIYLPNDVLVKVDRMSMAHALEVRAPLLDRRIVEFGFSVPPATKMPRLAPKELLRRIGRRRLPPEILDLPKAGFTMPIGEWIAGPYAGQFQDEVLGPRAHVRDWVDTSRVRALLADHRAGRADHSYTLWAVWVLERWSRLSASCQDAAPLSAAG
jgi:asparagine synthase (glutamine-hydrolysing)